MNDEPEGQLSFLAYSALRVLRHPKILTEINPFTILYSESQFHSRKLPVGTLLSRLTGYHSDRCNGVLSELVLPESLRRYKARDLLFGLVRILNSRVVVETGCGGGYGAAYILAAMKLNSKGALYSIDSASHYDAKYFNLPPNTPCGGMVPKSLRDRWHLSMEGSETELPRLLPIICPIDIFIHDSLHTKENMLFEYHLAWNYLEVGGLLISHDIWAPWISFAKEVKRDYLVYQHYGVMVK